MVNPRRDVDKEVAGGLGGMRASLEEQHENSYHVIKTLILSRIVRASL